MKINGYTVIFVTLNADALKAIRPVGFEPTIADSKGQCLKPIWPWTQNKTGTGRFELPTTRLTAGHSTAELRANMLRKTRRGSRPLKMLCKYGGKHQFEMVVRLATQAGYYHSA